MPKLRVHNLAMSLDGFAAGPHQSLDNPLGVGGERLHDWSFASRSWKAASDSTAVRRSWTTTSSLGGTPA